jgi:transcriptional regulator with XRE-family HTH domain
MLGDHILCESRIYLTFVKKKNMNLHDKVKHLRESKRLSQDNVAFELGLNQSQYSRRETGNIHFTADELNKLSKLLEVSMDDLFSDDSVVFNNNNQRGGYFGQNIEIPTQLVEQYELRLKEKDQLISSLKENIELLKSIQK